jgi:hypothetical protein
MNGYENLNEIDPAFALSILTGGLIFRFNPSLAHHRESIEFYLNYYSNRQEENKFLIATLGSSLFCEDYSLSKTDGHAFSLLDIIKVNNSIVLKIRNSQTKMKLNVNLSKK